MENFIKMNIYASSLVVRTKLIPEKKKTNPKTP